MLIVALVASMGFMSAVSSSEDSPEEIPPAQDVRSPYKDIDTTAGDIDTAYADIDIAYRVDSNVTGEEGTRATYNVDGGWLRIDEGAGTVCTGNAQAWTLLDVEPGDTCKITVDYTYIDTIDITGGYAIFRLTAPDGGVDEKSIFDRPIPDDGCTGELSRTFTVYPNNNYVFEIYCERGDDSFTDSANIYT
jgi:hypothetical protein